MTSDTSESPLVYQKDGNGDLLKPSGEAKRLAPWAVDQPPVHVRELVAVIAAVALCDLTIYRGHGFAGYALYLYYGRSGGDAASAGLYGDSFGRWRSRFICLP